MTVKGHIYEKCNFGPARNITAKRPPMGQIFVTAVEPYTFHSIRTRMQKFSLTKGKPYRYQRNGFRNMVI